MRPALPQPSTRISCAALVASLGSVAATPALASGDRGTAATAAGVEVLVPDSEAEVGGWASAPPHAAASLWRYRFPAGGKTAVSTGRVSTAAQAAGDAAAGEAIVRDLALFGGEITVARALASAAADAGDGAAPKAPGAWQVAGLTILGQAVEPAPNLRVELGDWGFAVVLEHASQAAAPSAEHDGEPDETASTAALRVVLTRWHGGLPPGTEIVVALARASADARAVEQPPAEQPPAEEPPAEEPPAEEPEPAQPAKPRDRPGGGAKDGEDGPKQSAAAHDAGGDGGAGGGGRREGGDAPQGERPGAIPIRRGPRPGVRLHATPGGYVFPVAGEASFGDTFGAARASVGWHHGEDIFAREGTPIVAVADGTLFRVGWNPIGGWRVWLRDRAGNEFYYAHLSAFAPQARPGATVSAGEVLGFVGHTGDARTTPPHLHFEIHPRQLLDLGYDGVVDAAPYLRAWQRLTDLDLGDVRAPRREHRRAEHDEAAHPELQGLNPPRQLTPPPPPAALTGVGSFAARPERGRAAVRPGLPVVVGERRVRIGSGDGRLWVDRRERLGAGHDGWRASLPA